MAKKVKKNTGIINESGTGIKGVAIMTLAGSQNGDVKTKPKEKASRLENSIHIINKEEEESDGEETETKPAKDGKKKV